MSKFMKVEVARMSSRSRSFIIEGENDCEINDKAYEEAGNADYTQATENGVEYEITCWEACDANGTLL